MTHLDPIYPLAVAALIAFVFAQAGLHKLLGFARHVEIVRQYRMAPEWLLPLLAPAVVVLESTVAVLVLWPDSRTSGLILAAALLLAYGLSIGLNLLRGRTSIDCGCGWGSHGQRISNWLLIRNALLAGLALAGCLPVAERPLGVIDWLLVALAGLALIAVYAIGELLIANWLKLSQLRSAHG